MLPEVLLSSAIFSADTAQTLCWLLAAPAAAAAEDAGGADDHNCASTGLLNIP